MFNKKRLIQLTALAIPYTLFSKAMHFYGNKESFNLDISGLPKERVLMELFNNVHSKSEASKKNRRTSEAGYMFNGAIPPNCEPEPTNLNIKQLINDRFSSSNYINYIDAVCFKMDFSTASINTQHYDNNHQTDSTPGVLTAKACIKHLRDVIEKENESSNRKTPS